MKNKSISIVTILPAAVVALILLAIPIALARTLCEATIIGMAGNLYNNKTKINMHRELSAPNDPNTSIDLNVTMSALRNFGIRSFLQYVEDIDGQRGMRNINGGIFHTLSQPDKVTHERRLIYFDKDLGLLVHALVKKVDTHDPDENVWIKHITAYAGPNGIARQPEERLGRFQDLLESQGRYAYGPLLVFDRQLARFYRIDFDANAVTASAEFAPDDPYRPVAFGGVFNREAAGFLRPEFTGSMDSPNLKLYDPGQYELILGESGRIAKFDPKTMKIVGEAGTLGDFHAYYEYWVIPVSWKNQYAGLVLGTADADLRSLYLGVFDAAGKGFGKSEHYNAWSKIPGGALVVTIKWLIENLHPPILNILACLTAERFARDPVQNTVFIHSNSYFAWFTRVLDKTSLEFPIGITLLMAPSILLVTFLARHINRNAANLGLSPQTRRFWIIGTILFGLVAYITWRLVRPSVIMVTCANCGKLRRPDFDHCQHCASPWHVPDLVAPAWRVLDTPTPCNDPAPSKLLSP